MSFKRQRTSSLGGYALKRSYNVGSVRSSASARFTGRAIKGSYSSAKGTPKSYRVRAPAGLKNAIKAVIASEKEQKMEIQPLYGGSITSLLVTDTLNDPTMNRLAPQTGFTTGADNGSRIGDQIQMTKSYLKFTLSLPLDSGPVSPYLVTLWIGKVRGLPSVLPVDVDFNRLLIAPGGGEIGPDTTSRVSNSYPVNDKSWDIKVRKVYKLGKASRSDSTTNPVANNDFNLMYQDEIDITRFMKQKLEYEAGINSNFPVNDGLYMWMTFTTIDDSTPTGTFPNVSGCVVHRYTDA